jgi:hypothetical protein
MARTPNQDEFESLGVDRVRAYVFASVWPEPKLSEAREWVRREDSRIARREWAVAIAAIVAAIAAVIAIILSLLR